MQLAQANRIRACPLDGAMKNELGTVGGQGLGIRKRLADCLKNVKSFTKGKGNCSQSQTPKCGEEKKMLP